MNDPSKNGLPFGERGPRPMTRNQVKAKEKRAIIYRMRAENHTEEDIAKVVEIPLSHVHTYLARAVRMDGFPPLEVDRVVIAGALKADPQAIGNVLAQAMVADATDESTNEVDKFRALHQACMDAGLPPKIVSALLKRLRTSLAPVMEEGRKIAVEKFTGELEKKISMVLEYIDDYSMANASFKDLNIGLSVMIEKHQLLSNKPTAIIDFTSRAQLTVLMPQLMAEAKRRGITIDATPVRIE